MSAAVVVLFVLFGALVLFVTEALPMGLTGLLIIAVLGLSGVLTPDEAVGAFASPAIVLVGSLYIVSAALIRAGVVNVVEQKILALGRSERRLLIGATLSAALFSAFLNNTSVVVLMVPIGLAAARRIDVEPSRLLMPLSFASILGGTMTLIGTSTNVLVADLAKDSFTIDFFDFLPVGAGFLAIGLAYLWFVAPRWLPRRKTVSSVTQGRTFEYVTELLVPEGAPAVGLSAPEMVARIGEDARLLQIVRDEEILESWDASVRIRADDALVLRGAPQVIVALQQRLRLRALPSAADGVPQMRGTTFAEIVITPVSELLGRTLRGVGLHRLFGVVAIAMQRRGAHLRHGITRLPLRAGDVILVQGAPEDVRRLRGQPGFMLLVGDSEVHVRRRAPMAVAILVLFVVAAALRLCPLPILALAAAVAAMTTKCITFRRAMKEVDWNILGLLAGAITLGLALTRSGIAVDVARAVLGAVSASVPEEWAPYAGLAVVYLLTSIATEFVSNSGAAALMVPIGVAAAATLGVQPQPFVFAVAFGASASFSTPIGYQTNAFIYGPGGYRFGDYLRVGLPLQLILWIFACCVLPLAFPF